MQYQQGEQNTQYMVIGWVGQTQELKEKTEFLNAWPSKSKRIMQKLKKYSTLI